MTVYGESSCNGSQITRTITSQNTRSLKNCIEIILLKKEKKDILRFPSDGS